MIKSPMVNSWQFSRDLGTLLSAVKPGVVEPQRTIAVQQHSYRTDAACWWELCDVLWAGYARGLRGLLGSR